MALVGVALSGYGVYVSHFVLERAAKAADTNGPRLSVAKASCRREALHLAVQVLFVVAGTVAMLPPKPWSRTAVISCLLASAALINLNSISDQLFRLRMFRYFERHPEVPGEDD